MPSDQDPDRGRPALIVSANPDVVDLYVLSLRNARVPVLSAGSVDEAIQLTRDRSISAIVVDVANPNVDWDVCRVLRSQAETGVPVIVLTGWIDADARQLAADIGCAAFIGKPASPDRVLDVVRRTRAGERDIFTVD